MAMGIVGMVASAAGTIMSGMASANAANYQAAVARNNAVIANRNADFAVQQGSTQAEAEDYKNRSIVGAQKAAQAANGVDVDSGSPLDVRTSSEQLGRLDTLTIINNAQSKASAYKAQSMNFTADAGLDSMKAQNYMTSSIIGGVGSFASKWSNYQMSGVLS